MRYQLMTIFRKLFLIDYKRKLSLEDPHQLTRDVKYESRGDRLRGGRVGRDRQDKGIINLEQEPWGKVPS